MGFFCFYTAYLNLEKTNVSTCFIPDSALGNFDYENPILKHLILRVRYFSADIHILLGFVIVLNPND